MLSIPLTLDAQAEAAVHKASGLKTPGRFLVSGMLAGAYIGVGVVLMVSAAGPLLAANSGLSKLVSGVVFSAALTIVVFAGSDLATSAMMLLPQAVLMRRLRFGRASGALAFMFVANLLGAFAFAGLVVLSDVLETNAAAGEMLSGMLVSKAHESPLELFSRGILCNALVCLAIWMSTRAQSEGAKIALIFVAITSFITSGYEHVVANMTTYWIGVLTSNPYASVQYFAGNMLWVGLGNLVGGGLIIGVGYWFVGGSPKGRAAGSAPALQDPTSRSARADMK